jgi:hypothetical protein
MNPDKTAFRSYWANKASRVRGLVMQTSSYEDDDLQAAFVEAIDIISKGCLKHVNVIVMPQHGDSSEFENFVRRACIAHRRNLRT